MALATSSRLPELGGGAFYFVGAGDYQADLGTVGDERHYSSFGLLSLLVALVA